MDDGRPSVEVLVGEAQLDELKKTLVSKGVRKIYLLTSRDASAAAFYKKHGFYVSKKMIMMGQWLKPIANACRRP